MHSMVRPLLYQSKVLQARCVYVEGTTATKAIGLEKFKYMQCFRTARLNQAAVSKPQLLITLPPSFRVPKPHRLRTCDILNYPKSAP